MQRWRSRKSTWDGDSPFASGTGLMDRIIPASTFTTNCNVEQKFDNNKSDSLVSTADIIPLSKLATQNGAVLDGEGKERSLTLLNEGQIQEDITGPSHISSTETSGSAYRIEGESDINGSSPGIMAEMNSDYSSVLKQELGLKIRENEEEIMYLRKRLSEYSYREAQIHEENSVLEKRIAFMRMAFDQQQQDLIDATSKAVSYKQDIVEENIRLAYALQEAQEDRLTFVSSLLPLLSDYSLQPQAPDAQTIVSNIKVLFKHLHEKLRVTEEKVKDSHYQLKSWRTDVNEAYVVSTSTSPLKTVGLELVHHPTRSFERSPVNYVSTPATSDMDMLVQNRNSGGGGVLVQSRDIDGSGKQSPLSSRDAEVLGRSPNLYEMAETSNMPLSFDNKALGEGGPDYPDIERTNSDNETLSNSDFRSAAFTTTVGDPSISYSPLSPVFEERSSSFSEADDDPLPAIEGLQISGEAFPGRELQACGFSINGTTSCNFEWVRHLENGSVNYIEGAKQPIYTVTADDVDSYLSIEVEPLDDRKRRGELVKVFANEHRKITCDAEMGQHIEKSLSIGHALYKVSLLTGHMGIWESASLSIKRDGYSIKCYGNGGLGVSEKFLPTTRVNIAVRNLQELSVLGSAGVEHLLSVDSNSEVSCSRDTIVLTMRLFISRANEKKRGKKKGLFFNK